MALEHSILKVSVGDDGLSILITDATTGYGVETNPFRSDVAWLLLATVQDGECEKVVPGVNYLLNTGTPEEPVYEVSDPLAATHAHVPLLEDGKYEIKSVLVHKQSALKPTDGFTALNLLYVDETTFKVKRVIEAHPEVDAAGENTGNYTYVLEELPTIEPAIEEGYPTAILPVLQLLQRRQALAKGNLSYLAKGNYCSKASTLQAGGNSCHGEDLDYEQQRDMCMELQYQIMGAEANFSCKQNEKLLVNLRESGYLASRLTQG